MKSTSNKKGTIQSLSTFGFTLVELIIVILILAILSIIAFMSFGAYQSSARDTNRVSDINSIQKALELYTIKTGNYPIPDDSILYTGGANIIINQGILGDNVSKIIGLSETTKDPLTQEKYAYSTFGSGKYYQIVSNLENNLSHYIINPFVQEAIAADTTSNFKTTKVQGNYQGSPSLPSLILVKDSVNTSSGIFDPNVCFVTDGKSNLVNSSSGSCIKISTVSLKDYDNSLIGYWDMNTVVGGSLKDLSGNGNSGVCHDSGTIVNCGTTGQGPQLVDGILQGKALSFDGVNDAINIGSGLNSLTNNNFTICQRIKTTDNNRAILFGDFYSLSTSGLNIEIQGSTHKSMGSIRIYTNYSGAFKQMYDNDNIVTDNNINLICITRNGSMGSIFVNGLFSLKGELFNGNIKSGINYQIGRDTRTGDTAFSGTIYETSIYNRALSDEEINQQAKVAGY